MKIITTDNSMETLFEFLTVCIFLSVVAYHFTMIVRTARHVKNINEALITELEVTKEILEMHFELEEKLVHLSNKNDQAFASIKPFIRECIQEFIDQQNLVHAAPSNTKKNNWEGVKKCFPAPGSKVDVNE